MICFSLFNSPAIQENRVATVQCLSGTGSLRVGGEFLARHYHEVWLLLVQRTIYIPQPTWGNHPKVFTLAVILIVYFIYLFILSIIIILFLIPVDWEKPGDKGLLADLSAAPHGAIVLLHACAHNPTGVDPTLDQWEQIRLLMRSKGLLPFFDSAYQVCKSADVAKRVESQLKLVIRPMYSNPPIHGASIVATILKDRYFIILNGGRRRISMAGLSSKTVPHLADAVHAAVTRMK
ncbi:hypothetical protein BHE74_00022238 [Ensete ventricosum]|nr:hypothetical protein BHE74_00022238 [Ensete ventricosum]